MIRRVWMLATALGISTFSAIAGASAHGQAHAGQEPPTQPPTGRRAIHPPSKPTDSPVSYGMLVRDTLYISGRVGLDPKTGKIPDDLDREIQNIFDDFGIVLREANMTMDDLVYVEVFTSDLTLYDRFNAVYRKQFKKDFPARSFVGAGSIFRGGHFELTGIAVRR